jgi:hypothetical protein
MTAQRRRGSIIIGSIIVLALVGLALWKRQKGDAPQPDWTAGSALMKQLVACMSVSELRVTHGDVPRAEIEIANRTCPPIAVERITLNSSTAPYTQLKMELFSLQAPPVAVAPGTRVRATLSGEARRFAPASDAEWQIDLDLNKPSRVPLRFRTTKLRQVDRYDDGVIENVVLGATGAPAK